jgi:hypothetical protein
MTDDNHEVGMVAPFLVTARELRERLTIRPRKLHLSTRSEAICRLVELGPKAKGAAPDDWDALTGNLYDPD